MSLDNVPANNLSQTGVNALSSGSEQSPAPVTDTAVHIAGGQGPISVRDAARSVIDWRRKSADIQVKTGVNAPSQATQSQNDQSHSGQEASADIQAKTGVNALSQAKTGAIAFSQVKTGVNALSQASPDLANESDPAQAGDDAGDPKNPPGETQSQDAVAQQQPPVDPPRSWSKEDKELFKALPRETQERLVERERSRDSDISRRQQEATERAKALEAERSLTEQARGQFEHALPVLLSKMLSAHSGEFADVQTMDDVQKLAVADPIRYTQWDAAQKRIAAVHQEIVSVQQRQAVEQAQQLQHYRMREAQIFAEKAPEFADPVQSKKLMDGAVTVLRDLGFQDQELGELWNGNRNISIHDHRLHLLLRDGIKWRDASAKAKTVQARPVPPVQRPGAAQPKGAQREAELQNLSKQIDNSKGVNQLRAAAALVAARRAAVR